MKVYVLTEVFHGSGNSYPTIIGIYKNEDNAKKEGVRLDRERAEEQKHFFYYEVKKFNLLSIGC